MTEEQMEEHVSDLIRELINSAKLGDMVRYRKARKELKRLHMENVTARNLINFALRGLSK